MIASNTRNGELSLISRRTIAAPPETLFAAWTEPRHLVRWWGPKDVECTAAEVDLQVGGRYRLANRFPDGTVIWIAGSFELIEPPRRLVYTWAHEPFADETLHTRVTVRFDPKPEGTEIIIIHQRFTDEAVRDAHSAGWTGCLDGLCRHFSSER